MTNFQESKVKDEDHVADDVLDLLVKDEHADELEIPINGLAPQNINSREVKSCS